MSLYLRFTLFILASGPFLHANTQVSITGKVVDAETRQPLANASVYCENSTSFTVTAADGSFTLSPGPGGYNLVISYIGYKTHSLLVSGGAEGLLILLKREDQQLKEVVVAAKSKRVDDGWAQYGTYFIENFIGSTPNATDCKLLNPEVLRFYFYPESNKIKVLSSTPLTISNRSLGYMVNYDLDSFVFYFNDNICSYQGYSRFTELKGNANQVKQWKRNRQKAYDGSVLHFMRDYYHGTLSKGAWEIALQQKNDASMFDIAPNPYDSRYFKRDTAKHEVQVHFPVIMRITYFKKRPEPEYMTQFQVPRSIKGLVSLIDLKDRISIMENGYYHHPLSWISYNYWSWKNIADMLPYDYDPVR